MPNLEDIHIGSVGNIIDWRARPDDERDDDEELEETPRDLVKMLGFDPKDIED